MSETLSNYSNGEMAAIVAEIKQLRAEQTKFYALIAPLVTRKESRKAQAKKAGCSTRTINRREKKASIRLNLAGIY